MFLKVSLFLFVFSIYGYANENTQCAYFNEKNIPNESKLVPWMIDGALIYEIPGKGLVNSYEEDKIEFPFHSNSGDIVYWHKVINDKYAVFTRAADGFHYYIVTLSQKKIINVFFKSSFNFEVNHRDNIRTVSPLNFVMPAPEKLYFFDNFTALAVDVAKLNRGEIDAKPINAKQHFSETSPRFVGYYRTNNDNIKLISQNHNPLNQPGANYKQLYDIDSMVFKKEVGSFDSLEQSSLYFNFYSFVNFQLNRVFPHKTNTSFFSTQDHLYAKGSNLFLPGSAVDVINSGKYTIASVYQVATFLIENNAIKCKLFPWVAKVGIENITTSYGPAIRVSGFTHNKSMYSTIVQ